MRNKYKGVDVKNRLSNTIIRWRGIPVICKTTDDGTILSLFDMRTRNTLIANVDPDDPNIDISSINLGYVQFPAPYNCAVYVRRQPRRIYKQGVDPSHLTYTPLSIRYGNGDADYAMMYTESVFDSLTGKFPTVKNAIDMITKAKVESVALSLDVGLIRNKDTFKFYIKGVEVGFAKASEPNVVIIPKNEVSWVHTLILSEIKGLVIKEGM